MTEKFCTAATVWALVERTGLDFGTVLNVLGALDTERQTQQYINPMDK